MFVGHTALALLARPRARDVSLGWLLAAASALDLLWPLLLLAGLEHAHGAAGTTAFNALVFDDYPWSHSLAMVLAFSLAVVVIARAARRRAATAGILGGLVLSHWLLDAVTHAPDLPLWPGDGAPKVGLRLWDSIPATYAVEGTLYALGIAIYLRTSAPRDRIGRFAPWGLFVLSALLWAAGPWGPPPPSQTVLGAMALVGYLLVAWAAWADRHRTPA